MNAHASGTRKLRPLVLLGVAALLCTATARAGSVPDARDPAAAALSLRLVLPGTMPQFSADDWSCAQDAEAVRCDRAERLPYRVPHVNLRLSNGLAQRPALTALAAN